MMINLEEQRCVDEILNVADRKLELEGYLRKKLAAKVDLATSDALKHLIKPHIIEEAVYA